MPCESGVAALINTLDGNVCVQQTIEEAKAVDTEGRFTSVCKALEDKFKQHEEFYCLFVGTYWPMKAISASMLCYAKAKFALYCPGSLQDSNVPLGLEVCQGSDIGPTAYAVKWVIAKGLSTKLFSALIERPDVAEIMQAIDDRIFNKRINENQIIYTGLYNLDALKDESLFSRFYAFFMSKPGVTLEAIKKCGTTVANAQMGMAIERAKKNTLNIKTEDGSSVSVTCSPDLINLSHGALRDAYKSDITVCVHYEFNGNDPKKTNMRVSIRSWNDKNNAQTLARTFSGDGNQQSSGGVVPVDFVLPFETKPKN
jgi:hypothetical protein